MVQQRKLADRQMGIYMSRRTTRCAAFALATGAAAITLGAAPAAAASTVVAQWQMNETSGTTMVDSSGHGNNGTTYNITRTSAGYSFNGTTSKVVVPNSSSLNPGTSNFSYSVKVKTSRVPPSGTDYDLIRKGISTTTGGEYKLEIVYSNGIGKAFCLVKDDSGVSATVKGTTNVTNGTLHTITCKKTSTGVILQVDGLAPRTKTISGGLGAIISTAPLTIGVKTPTVTGVAGDFYSGVMRSATISVG
jgi:Concanavalin A-like lectin/glucanases superfamily